MAFALAEAYVQFGQRGMSGLSGVLGNIHQKVMRLLNPINLVTGALGAMGVALSARSIARAFATQEMAEARLAAVVKATGGAAGYTSAQLKRMAADLQQVTTYGDEATIQAQAMLLTFKSIKGDMFKRTMEAIMDLSSVMGTDLRGSTVQVAKAMENPAKGMTALTRSGVTFTDQEKEKIKALQESGDLLAAQEIVLRALEGQFTGTSRAMAQTVTGRFLQMRNAIGDILEQIGQGFAETFNLKDLAANLRDFASTFWERFGGRIKAAMVVVRELGMTIYRTLVPVGRWLATYWADYSSTIVDAFKRSVAAVVDFGRALGNWLLPIIVNVGNFLRALAYLLDHNVAAGFGKLTLILVGTAGTIWAIGQVISIIRSLIVVFRAITAAVIWFHSVSGPQGWIIVAAGIGVAVLATWKLYEAYKALNEEMEKSQHHMQPGGGRLMRKGGRLIAGAQGKEEAGVAGGAIGARQTAPPWLAEHAKRLAAEFLAATPSEQSLMRQMTREQLLARSGISPEAKGGQMRGMDFSSTTLAGLAETMQQQAGERVQEAQLAAQERMAQVLAAIHQVLTEETPTMGQASGMPAWGETALGR